MSLTGELYVCSIGTYWESVGFSAVEVEEPVEDEGHSYESEMLPVDTSTNDLLDQPIEEFDPDELDF
jgi:hypothetical protein